MSNIADYMSDRLEDQIKWHGAKSRENKFKYHLSQIIIIVASGIIPIINLITVPSLATAIASSILGSLIIIVTGFTQLKKYQDNWILYRTNAEILKKEKYLFTQNAGEYSDLTESEKNKLLVERVEIIVSTETSKYFTIHRPEKASVPNAKLADAKP